MEIDKIKFAGFIMTYERSAILLETIDKIFSQTLSPEKILIVDNSVTFTTAELIQSLQNPKVFYHRVGYNAGPAGAASIGLRTLAAEGYDWIYWGDDDDPPFFDNTFEILLKIAVSDTKCGCVGVVGQFFNRKTGFMNRVSNELLQSEGVLEVDNIAGNMSKIINGNMIRNANILPDEKLFFGFEELDFDIQIKQAGYKLLVDRTFYWKHRVYWKRDVVPQKILREKSDLAFRREYYSTRNIFYICLKNRMISALICFFLYAFSKQFLRFKYGLVIGLKGFKVTLLAFFHFSTRQMGYKKIKI